MRGRRPATQSRSPANKLLQRFVGFRARRKAYVIPYACAIAWQLSPESTWYTMKQQSLSGAQGAYGAGGGDGIGAAPPKASMQYLLPNSGSKIHPPEWNTFAGRNARYFTPYVCDSRKP